MLHVVAYYPQAIVIKTMECFILLHFMLHFLFNIYSGFCAFHKSVAYKQQCNGQNQCKYAWFAIGVFAFIAMLIPSGGDCILCHIWLQLHMLHTFLASANEERCIAESWNKYLLNFTYLSFALCTAMSIWLNSPFVFFFCVEHLFRILIARPINRK